MKPIVAWLCAVVLLAACDLPRGGSTAPSALSGTTNPSVPTIPGRTHRVFGAVTAGGVPAVGVQIAEIATKWGDECFIPAEMSGTTTDANGNYSLSDVAEKPQGWDPWVRASKPGYFIDFRRPRLSEDTRLDFALDPWAHISLGEVVRGTVNAGDARCAGNSYGLPGYCERFAVTMPAAGTLEIALTWSSTRPDVVLDVVSPNGSPCALFSWPGASRHQLRIPADARSTYEIRVVDDGNASPLDFELTTALR